MRRLARELDVSPGALYWHFANKQAAARRGRRPDPGVRATTSPAGWRDRIAGDLRGACATRCCRTPTARNWCRPASRPGSRRRWRGSWPGWPTPRPMRASSRTHAELAARTVVYYVLGFTADEQSRLQWDAAGALPGGQSVLTEDPSARFAFGLRLLVDGMAAHRQRRDRRSARERASSSLENVHFGESKALSLFQTETVATIFGVSPRLVQCRRGWAGLSDVPTSVPDVITVDDVRRIASSLPRSYEVVVRDRIKFRVGRIVYVAFSPDETVMGFAFPKEERAALVASEPDKFMLPSKSDMRYNWIRRPAGRDRPRRAARARHRRRGGCACRRRLRPPYSTSADPDTRRFVVAVPAAQPDDAARDLRRPPRDPHGAAQLNAARRGGPA